MFDQILNLVGQPPGSLVYHFIILFAVEAAFAIAIGQWMREREGGTLRLGLAIFAVLCGRVALLIASLAAWQGFLPRNVLLPPVERLVDTLTILALLWAFVTMNAPPVRRRNFLPDVVTGLLTGIAIIGAAGTYYYWTTALPSSQLFNGLWIDAAWSTAQIALVILGLIWMLTRIRYIYDPFLKGIMLILLGAAAALHLLRPTLGDVAASMRVGQILVMPMLAAVAYRHVVEQLLHWDTFEPSRLSEAAAPAAAPVSDLTQQARPVKRQPIATVSAGDQTIAAEAIREEAASDVLIGDETVRRAPAAEGMEDSGELEVVDVEVLPVGMVASSALEVIDAVGGLFGSLQPTAIVEAAPRVVATVLRADVCALAIVDEQVQRAAILGSYDNIAQASLGTDVLDLADHPTIVNALGRLRQMKLTPARNPGELSDIYSRLGISHQGPAYVQPLVNADERVGVLIAGSPYSERQLSNEERNLLDRLGPLVTAALLNAEAHQDAIDAARKEADSEAERAAALADDLTERAGDLDAAQHQIDEMKAYIRDLHRQVEEAPRQQQAAEEQIATLTAELNRLRQRTDQLHEGALAGAALHEGGMYARQHEDERIAAQSEIAALRARLAHATATQQEVTFLQEQVAAKAREAVMLQTRLREAEAVSDALREQIKTGVGGSRDLEAFQARIAAQASQIARLKAELAEAQAATQGNGSTLSSRQELESFDRETMARLEAQLTERNALIEALEAQLTSKSQAIYKLESHMAEASNSLRALEAQLKGKTQEAADLQLSLIAAREEAKARIATLESALGNGDGDETEIHRAQIAALEAELAEKAGAVEALETQLTSARDSMARLERQFSDTHAAVDAAIADARDVDRHDEVIASIAQELRTPMNSILGYTELLLRESVGILGPLQRKFLQRVKTNTERMGRMLNDLIRITALDATQMDFEPERVDVLAVLEEAVTDTSGLFSEKGLTMRLAAPDALPAVVAGRQALLDVFRHLLTNAAMASPVEGEVAVTLQATRAELPGGDGEAYAQPAIQVDVTDSGVGIAADNYDRVFMRKYRADNPPIEGLGDTGVTLALAKALVEAHDGRIWLDSEPGAGTTFHVLLPLGAPNEEIAV